MTRRVVVIGGGVTGCGIARDLAMRGLAVTVIERGTLNCGTSGHSHGVLHSGARYADTDPAVARDCIAEQAILKQIARGCITDSGGLFIALSDDDEGYVVRKHESCSECGIPTTVLDDGQLRAREPALADDVAMGLAVPDAVVSPARLVAATAMSAREYGARVVTNTTVVDIGLDAGRVSGVTVTVDGARRELEADHVVNAAGPWVGQIGSLAGVPVDVSLSSGVMVVVSYAGLGSVVNRCRPPSDGDIVVPRGSSVVVGTTSRPVQEPTDPPVDRNEIEWVRSECTRMLPAVGTCRIDRWYQGIRALVPTGEISERRSHSRGFRLIDHAERDDVSGLTSIIGGKLTTHRLMAEAVANHVASVLGNTAPCRTAMEALPGSDDPSVIDEFVAELSTETIATDRYHT